MTERNDERNREIYGKRKSGMTYADIGREYGITGFRVAQIVERVELENARRSDPVMVALYAAADSIGFSNRTAVKAYNLMLNHGCAGVEDLIDLNTTDVYRWRTAGVAIEDIIATAQMIVKTEMKES